MDIDPKDINPRIVEIARQNGAVKKVMEAYLYKIPTDSGNPLTWMQALELMVCRLADQANDYALFNETLLEAKDSAVHRRPLPPSSKKGMPKMLNAHHAAVSREEPHDGFVSPEQVEG